MKRYRFFLYMIVFLLAGCRSAVAPTLTLLPTHTQTPFPTPTLSPTPTATTVPILTEISCKPATNPFHTVSDFFYRLQEYPTINIARVCTFSGKISRGQVYKHQITRNLFFCLVPGGRFAGEATDNLGWNIVITDALPGGCDSGSDDYVNLGPIVTPPMRGNMSFDVYGWHFRNKDNTGANDGSVNAPQQEHQFNFVFNRKDYEAEWYAGRCSTWRIDDDCARATQTAESSVNSYINRRIYRHTIEIRQSCTKCPCLD